MKRFMIWMTLVLGAVSAMAATNIVFTENFSAFAPFDPVANPVPIYDDNLGGGTTEQWLTGEAVNTTVNASGNLLLKSNSQGQTRALAYVFDPSQTAGLVAGDYTVSIDIINQYNVCDFELFAYRGVRDDTGAANTYNLDLLSPVGAIGNPAGDLVHTVTGTGRLTLLDSDSWSQGANISGTLSLTFSYDGTGDLVIVMDTRTSATFQKVTTLDNLTVSVVPPPPSLRLLILDK